MKRRFNQTPITTNVIQPANWSTLYNGYGSVTWDQSGVRFAPLYEENKTHAVMILGHDVKRDFTVKIKAKTIKQLRTPTPNAWECFWFVFNYAIASDGKKTANYIVLKPNGIEVGTMAVEIEQKFLYTGDVPKLVLNQFNIYEITKLG